MITLVAHTTPWHLICFFFTSWMLRALTAPVLEHKEKLVRNTSLPVTTLRQRQHLLLVGFHVEAHFVTRVHMDGSFHILRRVGKVEHLLWTITSQHQPLFRASGRPSKLQMRRDGLFFSSKHVGHWLKPMFHH